MLSGLAGADALLRSLDDRVSEFTLPNGLHFVVLERHMNPVASCHTFVNAGAYDEADKQTGTILVSAPLICPCCTESGPGQLLYELLLGLAHLLEHMAFKGTARIGTTDYRQEARVLDALDEGEPHQCAGGRCHLLALCKSLSTRHPSEWLVRLPHQCWSPGQLFNLHLWTCDIFCSPAGALGLTGPRVGSLL